MAIAQGPSMTITRFAISVTLVLTIFADNAAAQADSDEGPGPRASQPAPPPVPDATLQALRGRTLSICLRNGTGVVGELLGYDAASLTLALAQTREIVTLPRFEIGSLKLAEPSAASPVAATAAPAPSSNPTISASGPVRARHFGLQLGLAPGLMLDYESGHFYSFIHANAVLPMASSGSLLGFSAGLGGTFPIMSNSRWKMDVFLHFDPVRFGSDVNLGAGFGIGFHYTAANGFTLGFKVPIIGYSGTINGNNSAANGVAFYYLGGVMGLPVISLGYRF
jgi:hypothetical protein